MRRASNRNGGAAPRTGAARRLLAWYRARGRDLPWRRDPTPYRVWVSEIMLQQTTVAAAGPYFDRFMARFPTVGELARAREGDVLALWSGLGYYHRARNLLAAARIVQERHGGTVPADPSMLRALPGVGEYTAGAILSIGFGRPAPAIDGNIMRVVSRLGAVAGDPSRAATRARVADLVMEMMPRRSASAFNQALMDLGATVCSPRAPRCDACPLCGSCAARRLGLTGEIPGRPAPAAPLRVALTAVAMTRRAGGSPECLLVRRSGGSLMQGMWDFPMTAHDPGDTAAERVATSIGGKVTGHLGDVRHTITRHRMEIGVYGASPVRGGAGPRGRAMLSEPAAGGRLATPIASAGSAARRWVGLGAIVSRREDLALTGSARKIARLLARRMA